MDEVLYYADVGKKRLYSLAQPGGFEARTAPELQLTLPLGASSLFPFPIAISPSGDSLVEQTWVASTSSPAPSSYGREGRLGGLNAAVGERGGLASPLAWTTEGLYWLIDVPDGDDWPAPHHRRQSLWIVRSDSAEPEKLIDFSDGGVPPCHPSSMSLDGRVLVCNPTFDEMVSVDSSGAVKLPLLVGADLWVVDLEIDGLRGPGS